MKKLSLIGLIIVLITAVRCSSDPLAVSIADNPLTIDYFYLDSAFQTKNNNNTAAAIADYQQSIPDVLAYQFGYCWQVGLPNDPNLLVNIEQFKAQKHIKRFEKAIAQKFTDLQKRHQEITDGFKRLSVHFPHNKAPKSISYLYSNFAASAFCTETDIAIGLERYLGYKSPVIQSLPPNQFYDWMKKAMDDQFLERDAVCAWVMTHYFEELNDVSTIEAIIQWGKILYCTEAAFPEYPKEIILRYSKANLAWATENERSFWEYLVKQKMLLSTSEKDQANLLREAPFTAGLPEKGPDRLGQFLGWRIVHSYMEQYDLTLEQLIKTPYTKLLNEYEIND